MVFACFGAMAFANNSRRDNAHTFVTTRLSGENLQGPPTVVDADRFNHEPAPALYVQLRFVSQSARDLFYSDTVSQLQGVNGPVVGSWIAKHDCGDFEVPPIPCIETERQTF